MIVRILGEGQWRIAPDAVAGLNHFDDQVQAALEAGDQQLLAAALTGLHAQIRDGEQLPDEELAESDLVIPDADASLEEVSALLDASGSTEGLIPG